MLAGASSAHADRKAPTDVSATSARATIVKVTPRIMKTYSRLALLWIKASVEYY
jgi:hypothetical protein